MSDENPYAAPAVESVMRGVPARDEQKPIEIDGGTLLVGILAYCACAALIVAVPCAIDWTARDGRLGAFLDSLFY